MTICTSGYVADIRRKYAVYTLYLHRISLNFTKYGKYPAKILGKCTIQAGTVNIRKNRIFAVCV